MSRELETLVLGALRRVSDPCSVAARVPTSLVDMGLISRCTIDSDANVLVELCLTTPECMLSPHIMEAVTSEVRTVPGVGSVAVRLVSDRVWSTERITDQGRKALEARRRKVALSSPRPQEWREQAHREAR